MDLFGKEFKMREITVEELESLEGDKATEKLFVVKGGLR
jgi:hypothetical protein